LKVASFSRGSRTANFERAAKAGIYKVARNKESIAMCTRIFAVDRPSIFQTAAILIGLFLGLSQVFAEDDFSKDQPKSADHPALKRIEGSIIVAFEKQAFAEQCVALSKIRFDYANQKFFPSKTEIVEGPLTRILYRAPKNASTLEVIRQYQSDLKAGGFETLFEGNSKGDEESSLDDGYSRFLDQTYKRHGLPDRIFTPLSLNSDFRYSAFRKSSDAGETFVTIYAVSNTEWPGAFGTEKGQVLALVTVTEKKGMTDRMVKVSAAEMQDSLSKSGRIALYGIYFDFNKAEVKADSKEALTEIGSLMKSNPALKVLVVGHTDSIGGFETNKALSQRRADAVVFALTSGYGIASERLFPVGVSFAAPVDSNENEAGRAKNRRVELVKIVEK
jgi:OOP family OmpA-OmpF porin